jgi:chromosome segregation ATPase
MAESSLESVVLNGERTSAAGSSKSKESDNADSIESTHERGATEPDAQAMVIDSLRSQIQDLFSQVTQLNNKLVKSYDRVSDLEDNLHVASATIRSSTLRVSQLELERTQHLSALNTGLLVERTHVTAELTRLMEKATEEAAQRGQAETARRAIEKDLDDLSASLFTQANTMVAEARYARALSERKVEQAELALKGTEEAVATMQQQVQALQEQKQDSDKQVEEMRLIMGKGKWAAREPQNGSSVPPLRLLSSHLPYQEFLLFVAHLRSIHSSSPNPPAMPTLLPLPFLARLLSEDSCVYSARLS